MIENPYNSLIILAGGSSIPDNLNRKNFDNKFVFGLNHWCHYIDPIALIWLDMLFYSKNRKWIDGKEAVMITKTTNNGQNPINIIKPKITEHIYKEKNTRIVERFFVGIFALTLGIDLGFKNIYLLGYDCCEIDGKTHFHKYNEHSKKRHLDTYILGLKYFNTFFKVSPKNTIIYNVSPESAIEVFPKIDYLEFTTRLKKMKSINQEKAREWLRSVLK